MQQTSDNGNRRNRRALTTAVIAMVAMALGVGVGLAVVSLDLLPDSNETSSAATPESPRPEACPEGAEADELRIAAAPEIAPAIEELAGGGGQLEESLRCRDIQVIARPPSEIRAALSRGWVESSDGPPPHVWIPTTSNEVALARATSAASGMLGDEDIASIARSPTVIAMPQPMAEVVGWPDSDLSWNTVAKLAAADNAWAKQGHDAWGPFKLSFVEGVEAEPSMTAVAALTRAVGAVPADQSSSEAASAEQFEARAQLLLLERKVEYLGRNTQEQIEQLREADENGELLQTMSALPLTEQQAWHFNSGGTDGGEPPETQLAVWYPPDGGPDADYPYAVLEAPWSDQATSVAAAAFLDRLQSPEGQQGLQRFGFRDASRQATPELEQDTLHPDMAPPEPERVAVDQVMPVLQAWRGLSQTGNILTVIDVSGSMKTEVPGTGATRLELSAQGSIAGLQLFDPNTIDGLWEFSTNIGPNGEDYRELIPLGELDEEVNGVPRRDAAMAALRGLRPREDTGLYDTIAAAYEHLQDNYQPNRINALVVFTDGKNDDDDSLTLQQLQAHLRERVDPERQILILAVGYGPDADFEALNAITSVTDGKLYKLQRPEDIRNVFIDVQTGGVG